MEIGQLPTILHDDDISLFKQAVYHKTYDVSSMVLRRHNEVSRVKPAYKSREGRYVPEVEIL
jgi:hypothetical protein